MKCKPTLKLSVSANKYSSSSTLLVRLRWAVILASVGGLHAWRSTAGSDGVTVESHSQLRLPTGQFQRPHQVELGFQGWVGSQGKEQVQKPMGTSVRTTWFILLPQVRGEMRLDMRDRRERTCAMEMLNIPKRRGLRMLTLVSLTVYYNSMFTIQTTDSLLPFLWLWGNKYDFFSTKKTHIFYKATITFLDNYSKSRIKIKCGQSCFGQLDLTVWYPGSILTTTNIAHRLCTRYWAKQFLTLAPGILSIWECCQVRPGRLTDWHLPHWRSSSWVTTSDHPPRSCFSQQTIFWVISFLLIIYRKLI